MTTLTPGKMRGIDQLATDEGVIAVLAIDHRDSLRACLLYTSPSPRDATLSRMPSSA